MDSPDTISASNGHQQQSKAVKFSSTFSTYMTLLGFSLGFSDIWRFPFLAYRNGGGAFLIPFVIMTFVCGVPLYFLEYTTSMFSGRGPYQVWVFCPLLRDSKLRNYQQVSTIIYILYVLVMFVFRIIVSLTVVKSKKTEKTAIVCTFVDVGVAIFNGMVCFSVLVNMAHTYGIPITEVINVGGDVCDLWEFRFAVLMLSFWPTLEFSTGLVSYITALSTLPLPLPQLWIFLFILSGVLSGMEAQMIPLEMVMQLIGDLFPRLKAGFRIPTLIVITVAMFVISLPSLPTCTGAGAYLFLLVDWYAGTWTGTIVALFEVISISWVYGLDRFIEDVHVMVGRPLYTVFRWLLAFISPATVLVIFFMSCVEYVPPTYGSYHYPGYAQVIGWGMVVIAVAPVFGYAVLNIYRAKGTVTQRINSLCRPTDTWGPCGDGMNCNYRTNRIKYSERTFWDLFYFNVFGRYPKNLR